MCWCGLELCRPSLGILLKDCRVENGRRTKKHTKHHNCLAGHQGLRPHVAQSPKAGCLHCQPSRWRVWGPVWCGGMWELALGGGSHAAGYP